MKTTIKYIAPGLGAAAIGAAILLAPIASADTNPLLPYGTNPQAPNLGYYESNSGSHSAGDTAPSDPTLAPADASKPAKPDFQPTSPASDVT